jgi:hypothetical protein
VNSKKEMTEGRAPKSRPYAFVTFATFCSNPLHPFCAADFAWNLKPRRYRKEL